MKIRKLIRVLHRDFGYFITGIVLIYAISGIALNHKKDWNPHHIVVNEKIQLNGSYETDFDREFVDEVLGKFETSPVYKKHYVSDNGLLKIFVENGMVIYNPESEEAEVELLVKRPVFFHINKLHMAGTKRIWVWVSDAMSLLLIFVAVSGLFLIKGKKGITGRGLWLTAIGVAIPALFLLLYI